MPPLQPGTAAGVALGLGTVEHQSRVNLIEWLDQIIARYSRNAVKIEDAVGRVIPASYKKIMTGECGTIIAKLSALSDWMEQAKMAGENLGNLEVSYYGGGVGNTRMVRTPAGPFFG